MELITIALIVTFFSTIYIYFKHTFNYWTNKNIPQLQPSFPFGNIKLSFFRKFGQEVERIYFEYKKQGFKYGGFYLSTRKVFIPIDPDMIKTILTKDFYAFNDRGVYHNEEREFMTAHLFSISGPNWKKLRSKFTPTFSSSKLKQMMSLIKEKASKLDDFLDPYIKTNNPVDIRDVTNRLTNDIFCSIAFGIDCNSLVDPNAEFPKYGKMLLENNFIHGAKLICAMTWPKLFEKFGVDFFKLEFSKFFIKAITDVVEFREKNYVERPDFMNLLIKLKNNKNIEDILDTNDNNEENITLKQLITQCLVFYVGGFETSSKAISYCIFELAQHEDIQDKLRDEIQEVIKEYDGQITYEGIQKMEYLDKVVSESMRKYPPVIALTRKAVEDWKIPNTDSVIEKGIPVFISTLGLHHDPEYYPDPEKFDPERFTEEEKSKWHPYTYIPFGEGPKNCIGLRFGLLQVKIGVIYLLKNYKYNLNSKTKLPLEFLTEAIFISNYGPICLNVQKI